MKNLRMHWITTASKNAAESLSMAMYLHCEDYVDGADTDGIQEMVEIMNSAAIKLRHICEKNNRKFEEIRNAALDARNVARITSLAKDGA